MQPSEVPSDYSKFDDAYRFVFSRLSERDRDDLDALRFRDLVQEWMDTRGLTEAQTIDAIRNRAKPEPFWFTCTIDFLITEYKQMRSAGLIPEPIQKHQPLSLGKGLPVAPPAENSSFINVSAPEPPPSDSRVQAQDSDFGKRLPMDIPKETCYLTCNGQRKG
jgi:hypothetical protein